MKNSIVLIGVVIGFQFFIQTTYAQSDDLLPTAPVYVTPSPQAMAITRYGDYPVDYSRGLVDMSVPLYNVRSGSLSLPIDISFHASGRMANETNGILGMRWVLNCGGVVTREMRGRPDEWQYLTPYAVNPTGTPGYEELYRSCTEYFRNDDLQRPTKYDSEYDVFRYVLPSGKSGQFIMKNENGIKKAMTVPYEPLKIEMVQDNSHHGYYGAVNITDVDGTIYRYGDGTVVASNYCESHVEDPPHEGIFGIIPTGWYLLEIISADRQDTIHLEYERKRVYKSNYYERIVTADRIRDNSVTCNFYPNDDFGPGLIDYLYELPREYEWLDQDQAVTSMDVPFISSIKSDHGMMDFKYITDLALNRNNIMLSEIEISGAISRKIGFETILNANEKDVHYLKAVQFLSIKDGLWQIEEKYSFDYYEPASASSTFGLYGSSISRDWWGYYNKNILVNHVNSATGVLEIPATGVLVTPPRDVLFIRSDCGSENWLYRTVGSIVDRDTDLESKKMGMLKSITFPTGGKTTFDYEDNYYTDNNGLVPGPGIRIMEILDIPNEGKSIRRWFKYGENEDHAGRLNDGFKPGNNAIQESGMMVYWDFYLTCDAATGACSSPKTEKLGYRIRDYLSDPIIVAGDNNIWYNQIVEYKGDNELFIKDVYTYYDKYFDTENFVIDDSEYVIEYPRMYTNPYRSWQGGKIRTRMSYKKALSGQYSPAMLESYDYEIYTVDEAWDMPTYRHVPFAVEQSATTDSPVSLYNFWYNEEEYYHQNYCSVIGYGFRQYISGAEKLRKKTTEIYTESGTIITTRNLLYDAGYHQLKSDEITASDNQVISVRYDYPFDNISSAANQKMLDLNMISYPLIKSHYSNGQLKQQRKTTYKEWAENLICPEMEFYKEGDHEDELFVQFIDYDSKGNPLQINFKGNTTAYVWSYNQTYPTAEVAPASCTQIAYTSFESSPDNGGWTFSGSIHELSARTGQRSYRLQSAPVTKSLTPGKYSLEFWSTGAVSVTGATVALISSSLENTWTLYRYEVNATSNVDLVISSDVPSMLIDELRLHPTGAQMKTYTYHPLIGTTSVTDANHVTSTYEYDDFGRLIRTKDNKGSILKAYEYNYKQN